MVKQNRLLTERYACQTLPMDPVPLWVKGLLKTCVLENKLENQRDSGFLFRLINKMYSNTCLNSAFLTTQKEGLGRWVH